MEVYPFSKRLRGSSVWKVKIMKFSLSARGILISENIHLLKRSHLPCETGPSKCLPKSLNLQPGTLLNFPYIHILLDPIQQVCLLFPHHSISHLLRSPFHLWRWQV